jgi:hypothetical protein
MERFGLLVLLKARDGKEESVEEFLEVSEAFGSAGRRHLTLVRI